MTLIDTQPLYAATHIVVEWKGGSGMGASGWSYFVPYQADLNKALEELRQQSFINGDYYKPAMAAGAERV